MDTGALTANVQSSVYSFRVAGNVGPMLTEAFPDLRAQHEGRTTVLTGELRDQAELHGVLALIESLGIELIAVERLASGTDESTGSKDHLSSGSSRWFAPGKVD